MGAVAHQPVIRGVPLDAQGDGHRVGPNAIIQTGKALEARHGKALREAVFADAGLGWIGSRDPTRLVRAQAVVALNSAVRQHLPADDAERVMWEAGVATARYILRHRIPPLAQRLLGALPAQLGMALLLRAIGRHAWTFAGAANVQVGANWIRIDDNPVCLGRSGFSGCIWHRAVFATLIETITGRDVSVVETHCLSRGDDCCRFTFRLHKAFGKPGRANER